MALLLVKEVFSMMLDLPVLGIFDARIRVWRLTVPGSEYTTGLEIIMHGAAGG